MAMQLFQRFFPDEAENHFRQGLHCRDRRKREFNFSAAVRHFKEAIKLNYEIGKYHSELGRTYVAAPLLAITRGIGDDGLVLTESLKLAIDELNEAIRLDSSQVETYMVLGEVYMYQGKKQGAIDAFQTVLKKSSLSFSLFFPIAFIDNMLLKSCAKRRLKYLEQGMGREPQADVARECIKRAMSYRDEGRYRLAERELMRAFEVAPDWAWIYKAICKLSS